MAAGIVVLCADASAAIADDPDVSKRCSVPLNNEPIPAAVFEHPAFQNSAVEVEFRIMPDGSLRDFKITRASGFPELDQMALRHVARIQCKPVPDADPPTGVVKHVQLNYQRDPAESGLPSSSSRLTLESYHKRGVIMSGAIPYDRSYEQLSPEQKAAVRAEYDSVGPKDEPPYPKYGLADVADAVSRMSVSDPVEGDVVLTVRVDERGDAKSVSIYKTPDARLSNLVALMLTRSKFKPGVCEGQPCAMDYVFKYYFKLRG